MENIVIKEIKEDTDIKKCLVVLQRAFKTVAYEFGLTVENAPTNPAFLTFEKLKQSLPAGIRFFGLSKESVLIGCVAIERSAQDGRVFFIERLAVLPGERHHGYGTRLLDFAFDYIKKNRGTSVSIGIINENQRLKKWYIKYGFKETGIKKIDHLPFTVCFLQKPVG